MFHVQNCANILLEDRMHHVLLNKIDPNYMAYVRPYDALCNITIVRHGPFLSNRPEFLERGKFSHFFSILNKLHG